ncbi:DNA recombination protein RmuC [Maricaulis sp.]|uniref:DNA recombination protein RmuC n=1 Tax=Maricaulis sp. TaxID=1486257 RepID=UPI001AFDF26D|nr:DNA recombination protein RmuC [Maricaulis sp.]MBO6764541.1 DNA recombination protein RmuC [Maricaulis sp.]
MMLTEIAPETWLLLGGMALAILLLAVLILRRPKAQDGFAADQAETLRAERDQWRETAEQRATEAVEAREKLARLESVREERDRLLKQSEELRAERDRLSADFASLKSEHDATQRHHGEKLAELDKARERLTEQFKLTASEILKTSGAELNKQSAQNLQTLLNPLRDQLKDFREKVEKDATERSGHAGEIKQLMETVRKDAHQMSADAKNLANALRSSSKVQGDWGEMVLATILERAGLREGHEFFTQQSETTEDGARRRPDIVVELPGKQRLVIDSKVSLTAFERCVNAEEEEERGAALKQHLTSVRSHIKALGEKDYAQFYEGVSFTLMFVPLEGAASLALQNDPDISVYAWERDVMIATPTTLMMAMRTVQNLWTIDRQNQNAREIASRAGALYDKFEGFVGDLEKVGQRIDAAKGAWHDAKNKLVDGRGNVIRQTEMLKKLGASTKKSLPDGYLDAAGLDEDDGEPRALSAPEAESEAANS